MINHKFSKLVLVLFISICVKEFLNTKKPKHPDAGLNIEQLIQKYGYSLETHEVTTDDGYILTLHRIPHGRDTTSPKKRIPVLFMHGFSQSAAEFVKLGPGKALSFLLADKGYDIWLGHVRGTTWSRKHKNLNPEEDWQFWDYRYNRSGYEKCFKQFFSLHEIGKYDASAFTDYILKTTGHDQLHYIGYSQGTIVFFILLSEKPEYAAKTKLMTALAPAIFLKDPGGPLLKIFVFFRKFIESFFDTLYIGEVLSQNKYDILTLFLNHICNENSMFVNLCLHQIFLIQGYHWEGINKTSLSLIFSNMPAGASSRQMMHIVQFMEIDNFRQYDFGKKVNLLKYGQQEPPEYDLSKATTPVALYYSTNDWTVNIKNIEKVVKTLPNIVKSYHVPLDKFNHDDFVHSDLAPNLVYNAVIEEILKY